MNTILLGLKIKKLRSEQSLELGEKITQQKLAKKLGISRSYLGDIESGRTIPNDEIIDKIAKALNVSPEYLKGESIEKNPGETTQIVNEIQTELETKLNKMAKDKKIKTINKLKEMLNNIEL
ncbi:MULTISPECIES: helix-turn-helix domain-containing protein [Clostridium]|uniref:Helix-turn-helix domain-containing protein n=1 Tax=Clostridium lapidicellarium TaxID=3240931 RepID=A0ABV4DXT3_9CLOT